MRKLFVLLTIILILGSGWLFLATPAALDSKVGVSRTRCGLSTSISSSGSACYIEGNDITTISQTNPSTPGILGPLAGTTFVSAQINSVPTGTTFIDLKLIAGTNPFGTGAADGDSYNYGARTFAEVAVKATPGVIKHISCDNTLNNEVNYLQLYDLASGPVTVGTTVPSITLTCGGGTTGGNLQVFPTQFEFGDKGIAFTTAITAAICKNTGCTTDVDVSVPLTIIYR